MEEKILEALKEIRDELIFISKSIQKQTEVLLRTKQPCGQDQANKDQQQRLQNVLTSIQDSVAGTPFADVVSKVVKAASMTG